MNESVNILPNDVANNVTSNLISNLSFDDKGYLWKGTLQQLKRFVSKDLNLVGKWSSPGGERKIFNDSTLGITLRWSGLTRGRLTIVHRMKNHICPHIRTGCRECKCREYNTFAIVRINVQM